MKAWFKRSKRILVGVLVLSLVAASAAIFAITASAELVNVYSHTGPTLTMANISNSKSAWAPQGKFVDNMDGSAGDGNYKFTTNAQSFWYENDSLDFAYERNAFNTGRGSILTLESTITAWDGTGSGSAGIHVRNSLEADSSGVYLCVRPGQIFLMYRKSNGILVNRGIELNVKDNYPIQFRLVLNKTKNTASGYYKMASDKDWINVGNVPFVSQNYVYTGIAAHSHIQSVYSTCAASGFYISLDAPEGYVAEEGEGGSAPEVTEPKVELPEDVPVTGDVLLRETFTDGDLFPEGEKITVDNPQWTVRAGTPEVQVNEVQTNRYLYANASDPVLMMTAGDMHWTDYSASVELFYPSGEISPYETNTFHLMFRHKSVVIGGSTDYAVTLVNKFKGNDLLGQYLQLNWRYSSSTFLPEYTTLKEVCLAEGGMVAPDVKHTIRVDAMDNTYQVYFDGECVITWDDTDRAQQNYESNNYNENNYPHLRGCVGICTEATYLQIDNLTVRKLSDPMGGDYDNEIGGAFDQPIPDYIKDKYGRD